MNLHLLSCMIQDCKSGQSSQNIVFQCKRSECNILQIV